jgi:two-component system nitrogen regulation sensor histidine kinase GlnL
MNTNDLVQVLSSLPSPVLLVARNLRVRFANHSAEEFFGTSTTMMKRNGLSDIIPFASPLTDLIERCIDGDARFNEYAIDLGTPRNGRGQIVDLQVAPASGVSEPMAILMIQPRSIADKIDRQLTHRGAARSVSAMAAMLAHEIKNPLSGIRGAAQLLESDVGDDGAELTQLICTETARIAGLVDEFEMFSDRPAALDEAVNVHSIIDHVRRLSQVGFANNIRFTEKYDPSLPDVLGDKDMLTQVFLNLVKNASEALEGVKGAEIQIQSAFRPGVRLSLPGKARRVSLPLEFCVIDNGPGVPENLRQHLFEPFVTTKSSGTGLGLALVAKIIGDHGGVVECDSRSGYTCFRILLPMATGNMEADKNAGKTKQEGKG